MVWLDNQSWPSNLLCKSTFIACVSNIRTCASRYAHSYAHSFLWHHSYADICSFLCKDMHILMQRSVDGLIVVLAVLQPNLFTCFFPLKIPQFSWTSWQEVLNDCVRHCVNTWATFLHVFAWAISKLQPMYFSYYREVLFVHELLLF